MRWKLPSEPEPTGLVWLLVARFQAASDRSGAGWPPVFAEPSQVRFRLAAQSRRSFKCAASSRLSTGSGGRGRWTCAAGADKSDFRDWRGFGAKGPCCTVRGAQCGAGSCLLPRTDHGRSCLPGGPRSTHWRQASQCAAPDVNLGRFCAGDSAFHLHPYRNLPIRTWLTTPGRTWRILVSVPLAGLPK